MQVCIPVTFFSLCSAIFCSRASPHWIKKALTQLTAMRLHFLVVCVQFPEDYPSSAPQIQFLTTNGGKTRFNPNLYADGKVCLSILGTWRGESGEQWSSVQNCQVFTPISSYLLHFAFPSETSTEDMACKKGAWELFVLLLPTPFSAPLLGYSVSVATRFFRLRDLRTRYLDFPLPVHSLFLSLIFLSWVGYSLSWCPSSLSWMTGRTIMSPVLRRCAICFSLFLYTYLKGMLPRSNTSRMCDDLQH